MSPISPNIINETSISNEDVMAALREQQPHIIERISHLEAETASTGAYGGRGGGGGYTTYRDASTSFSRPADGKRTPYQNMILAREAAENDDIVSGLMDSTEALSIRGHSVELPESQAEENLWVKILDDLNLTGSLQQQRRDWYRFSQGYVGTFWGHKTFTVDSRDKSGGLRKKTYKRLKVPTDVTTFDPLSIWPMNRKISLRHANDFAYLCFDRNEALRIRDVLDGKVVDKYISNFMVEEIPVTMVTDDPESKGIDTPEAVFIMKNVYDFSLTKDAYKRFADVRMASIFDLLDLKYNLKIRDRAQLIGSSNVIITIKKGSDEHPAVQSEIDQLDSMVNQVARLPIIVSDHRLEVDIASYKDDSTLASEKYNNLDARITGRMLHLFVAGNYTAGTSKDSSATFIQVAARTLESHRDQLIDAFKRNIIKKTVEANKQLEYEPTITADPKRIALDFDPAMFKMILDLRDRGDISRETTFSFIDVDQEAEAKRRQLEKDVYDDVFTPTNVPFDSKDGVPPSVSGRKDGGTNTESFQDNGNENTQ